MDTPHTLMETLGMETITQTQNQVIMTMPVDKRTYQPAGFLHGGASVALAETAASIGALLNIDTDNFQIFGIDINANHIKSKRDGYVTAKAEPVHLGHTTMVWNIRITDEHNQLICISRSTIGIVSKENKY